MFSICTPKDTPMLLTSHWSLVSLFPEALPCLQANRRSRQRCQPTLGNCINEGRCRASSVPIASRERHLLFPPPRTVSNNSCRRDEHRAAVLNNNSIQEQQHSRIKAPLILAQLPAGENSLTMLRCRIRTSSGYLYIVFLSSVPHTNFLIPRPIYVDGFTLF